MAQSHVINVDDKKLRDLDQTAMPQVVPSSAGGIANPAPLGLLCFGMTTVMLMFIDTKWGEEAMLASVISYAVFYGGFGQMVAGVFELIKGNTFAGTAFFSYGAFWMAFFVVKYITATAKAAALASNTLPAFVGTFAVGQTLIHCLWGVFTFGFFIPTLRKNGCLMTVFGTLFVTFFLLAGGVWSKPCSQAAGYVGFMCGCSAIYTAFAEIYHESLGIMLPGLRPVRFI
eukprot:GHUV01000410.1.p1 GENE.GHUV01000410.1~~GHUV01000410.1.p1  ORF type:complete len:229 (+),score=47.32 GHUV01000410.1:148-834(+)